MAKNLPSASIVEGSPLWKKAFPSADLSSDADRTRLLESFRRVRERIQHLLTFIPADMQGYTVHDISHLDALWEMGSLIAGDDAQFNPSEAYVFGLAVLLHDAAMTVVAFSGGRDELENTTEWKDSVAALKRADEAFKRSDTELKALATTGALRLLHARKAKELATQKWQAPNDTEPQYLIEDSDLRHHYGEIAGKIAYSHHWDIASVPEHLSASIGAFGSMPIAWTVDSVKVALLLRCADAAHIDHRRAPRLLLTLTRPNLPSRTHWDFQKRIAKPHIEDRKLVYTGTTFPVEEAEAWQLCCDTIKMIDRELDDSNDILIDTGRKTFHAIGVAGAKSPTILAEHIPVSGWKPVSTEILVSDVPRLARSVGGRDLYAHRFAPLRELLQNAADAVEARASIDPDFDISDGLITVRVHDNDHGFLLHLEDNGIGMSERTITRALLDFGYSFWRSEAARIEFPGLQSKFTSPRGRFGIGFFSVFIWSNEVQVSSRRYADGLSDAWVLEFKDGLGHRPILRRPAKSETSTKFTTRISLQINPHEIDRAALEGSEYLRAVRRRPHTDEEIDWHAVTTQLCATLPIKVVVESKGAARQVNLPNWQTASQEDFLALVQEVVARFDERTARFARAESPVFLDSEIVGRAFVMPEFEGRSLNRFGLTRYERGIFIDQVPSFAAGIVESQAANVARERALPSRELFDEAWFQKQSDYVFRIADNLGEVLPCIGAFLSAGRLVRNQQLFILARQIVSLEQLLTLVRAKNRIAIRLSASATTKSSWEWRATNNLDVIKGLNVDPDQIFCLRDIPGTIETVESIAEFFQEGSNSILGALAKEIAEAFGGKFEAKHRLQQQSSYSTVQDLIVELVRSN